MKIIEEGRSVSLSEGPNRGLGLFISIGFGLPGSLAGTFVVLGYFGLFPSDTREPSMLVLGATFFIVGIFFACMGVQLFLRKKLLELTSSSLTYNLTGLFKKLNQVYSASDVEKFDVRVINDDYRSGKQGSLFIRLKNGEEIECFTGADYKELKLVAKKISELGIAPVVI